MTTSASVSNPVLVIGSALRMMSVLFPEPLKSQQSVETAANARFEHEWKECTAGWGEDEDSRMAAAEELMSKGILLPFNGGKFDLTAQFEIDQVRERLGLDTSVSEDFLEIITNAYAFVMRNAGKEAGALCLQIQVENQSAAAAIENTFEAVENTVTPENIDSEGPADPIVTNTAAEGGVETATFSQTTSEAEPTLNTSDWDEQVALLDVQNPTELEIDNPVTGETEVATSGVPVAESSDGGSGVPDQDTAADEITSNTAPTVVNGPVNIEETIAAYDAKITDLFLSPITAREIGELKLELQDAETHDFDARIRELGGVPSESLQYAQMDRMERLVNLIAELTATETTETTDEVTTEAIVEPTVEADQTITGTHVEPVLELKKPYELAGFSTHEAWVASFPPKEERGKIVKMKPEATLPVELNQNGKYSSKKGNVPIKSVEMTEKQSALAAKKLYRTSKKSTNLVGMSAALKNAFALQTYEMAKLNTCAVGEKIHVFPSNLSPNQYQKNSAIKHVKIGTAYFNKAGLAFGFGLHWRNLPTLDKGETPNFQWPVIAATLNYEQKSRGTWYKNQVQLAVPMIIDAQFGHAEQTKSGKMPTVLLKDSDPVCYKPIITAASSNNLAAMTNLGHTYLGTVEVPKGREFMHLGITGMKIHIFKNRKAKGMKLSEWEELGLLS